MRVALQRRSSRGNERVRNFDVEAPNSHVIEVQITRVVSEHCSAFGKQVFSVRCSDQRSDLNTV